MTEQSEARVAVYLDFDNIVISRYNQLHGRNQFSKDKVRDYQASSVDADAEITKRMHLATVDIGAVLDYASSFGSIVISRAYADWSAAVNAGYQRQLIGRAVDLTRAWIGALLQASRCAGRRRVSPWALWIGWNTLTSSRSKR